MKPRMNTDFRGLGKGPEAMLKHENITREVIGAAFEVYRVLGYGFLEKVYQRAMQVELLKRGIQAELEHPIQVHYRGVIVGDYFADLFVEGVIIVEIKVAAEYNRADEAQVLNELKATGVEVGLLLNFGRREVEVKRLILTASDSVRQEHGAQH